MTSIFRMGTASLLGAVRWVAITCLLAVGAAPAVAQAAPRPSFSTTPSLDPAFAWPLHDYAIRCDQSPVSVQVNIPDGWEGKLGSGGYHSEDFVTQRALTAGDQLIVTFHGPGDPAYSSYHVRCLPPDFPEYEFTRTAPGGPGFFVVQMNNNYATIFNRHGVPVWWYRALASPINAEMLPDGTIAWDPVARGDQTGNYVVRRLNGRLLRAVKTIGGPLTDIHELQLLRNGNYLLGGQLNRQHMDASPYGGSSDGTVRGFQIQEVTPAGKRVWKWNSLDHIGLGQTPTRWWNYILAQTTPQPYNIQHWNAVEPAGKHLLLSFRHLDAIYEINRQTGSIVWKLGGTPTSKSLDVLNDPYGSYPLGGSHDPRLQPDGTVTIYDNFTDLNGPPRAVRYRIDPKAGTAKLVQSITDPEATESFCCGSARRLPSGYWLIDWGGLDFVGGYNPNGRRIFKLQFPNGFSYRAFPVPTRALTAKRLRHAMNALTQ